MSSSQHITPSLKWEIAPGWESVLMGPEGPRVEQWLRDGAGQIVKHGAHRTVYRIDLPQQTLFVKHYRCPRWLGVWRYLIEASHSRREWRKALEVARRKVPTARPVAIAEQQRGGLVRDNYYVCEGIPNSQSLDDYVGLELPLLSATIRSRQQRQMIVSLARLMAAAHEAGIDHNDLHTGNILIRWPQSDAEPELYLIDLPGIRVGSPLNWPRSRDSLAMLGGGWLMRLSRADRWRFWSTYLAQRGDWLVVESAAASEAVMTGMRRHARRVAAARDKRSLKNNRDFRRIRRRGAVAFAVREFPREQLDSLLQDPAAPLRRHRDQPVKLGLGSVVVEARLPLAKQATHVAYKRSRPRTWLKRLLAGLRRNRSLAGWQTGHALLARGIATARPLAAIQPSKFAADSFLATEWIEGALNLHLLGWQLAADDPQRRHLRACRVAESLGRLIGRMHAWRISHGDLKGCNLVAVDNGERVATYLLDLDSVRFLCRMTPARQANDLARLAASIEAHPWLSRTVRLRFLRAYLAELNAGTPWKQLWRQTSQRAVLIVDRFRRVGRSIA